MAQSKYFRRVDAANRNLTGQNDVERGWDLGTKMSSALSKAIGDYQKNALANKLMTEQDISDQPGAGQTQDLGKLGGPQPGAPDTSNAPDTSSTGDQGWQDPDPNPIPDPSASPGGTTSDPYTFDLSNDVAAKKAEIALPPITVTGNAPPDQGMDFSNLQTSGPANNRTVGSLVHRGGVAEMDLRKDMLAQQIQKADLADKLARAAGTGEYAKKATPVPKGGYRMSTGGNNPWEQSGGDGGDDGSGGTTTDGTGGGGYGGGKSKKPPPYEAGSFDAENDAPNDNYHKIKTDFDGRYGDGAYKRVAPLMNTAKIQPDGSVIIPDPKDDTKTLMTISKDDAKFFMDRMNNVGNRQGMSHIGPLGEGANRYSNAPVGSETNPVVIHNNREFFALPYGTVAKDVRNGAVVRRLAPGEKGATHG